MSAITPDSSYGVDLDPTTATALARFSRRRRALLIVRALTAGVITWVVAMAVVALCDYLWFLGDTMRWSMSVVGYALVLAMMWWYGLRRKTNPV